MTNPLAGLVLKKSSVSIDSGLLFDVKIAYRILTLFLILDYSFFDESGLFEYPVLFKSTILYYLHLALP